MVSPGGARGKERLSGGLFPSHPQPITDLVVNLTHPVQLQMVCEPPRSNLRDLFPSR
jgi:hypothetical protein